VVWEWTNSAVYEILLYLKSLKPQDLQKLFKFINCAMGPLPVALQKGCLITMTYPVCVCCGYYIIFFVWPQDAALGAGGAFGLIFSRPAVNARTTA